MGRPRQKPERPWVVMLPGEGDGHLHGLCLGCGYRFVVGLPAPISVACKTVDLYLRHHGPCGAKWIARGKPEKLSPEEIHR